VGGKDDPWAVQFLKNDSAGFGPYRLKQLVRGQQAVFEVEIVFSWGGAGQYAVQGVLNSDIYPVLGFVLFSAIFSLVVYVAVDLIYVLVDPRISH